MKFYLIIGFLFSVMFFVCCSDTNPTQAKKISKIITYQIGDEKYKFAEELFDTLGRSVEYKVYYQDNNQIRFLSKTYYDSLDRKTLMNLIWFPENSIPNRSWIKFKYNNKGQLTKLTQLHDDDTIFNTYEYNAVNQIKTELVNTTTSFLLSGKIIYFYNKTNKLIKKEHFNNNDEIVFIDTFIYSNNLTSHITLDPMHIITGKTDSLFINKKLLKIIESENKGYPENVHFSIERETHYNYFGNKLIHENTRYKSSNNCINGDSIFIEKLMYKYQ